ncbi:MAG: hypothetical protein ACRYFS_06670 [Janthinobacterium lividum]
MQAIQPVSLSRNSQKTSSKKLYYALGFLLIVASILGSFLLINPTIAFTPDDYLTIGTFAAIGIWSLGALYLTMYNRPFSLNCTHWVFVLFFLCYAPLIQFLTQSFPGQADIGAFGVLHLKTNGLIFLWCVFYSLTYFCVSRARSKPPVLRTGDARPNYQWLVVFCLGCTLLSFATVGASNLLRINGVEAGGNTTEEMGSAASLITGTIGRACPLGAMIILFVTGRRREPWYYAALACVAASALLTNFPTAITRFLSGSIMISYVCVALRYRRIPSLWLLLLFWLSFVIAMPFLNLFRTSSFQDANVSTYKQQDLQSTVTGGDFDAYMMLVATVSYGEKPDNITWGRQLAGSLLFFVPRPMWPDKPVGSGTLAVQNTVLSFYNLSEPLPAEGYINFGAAGVPLFAIVFAWILAALDKKYWAENAGVRWARPNLVTVSYPLLIGLVVFIMRGALLSSYAYTIGLVGACWISLQIAYLEPAAKKIAKKLSSRVIPYAKQPAAPLRPTRLHAEPRD